MSYAIGVAGVEHVAVGPDFGGSTTTPIDASGMGAAVDALRGRGLSDGDIRQFMGGNTLRFFSQVLPER